ncbi:MAG: helix-turn-helix domain containing protein, partial [Deltaproteobacteria bacterium]|nr:helix-turn-helix domain containing protein [Deltaproteobacteria bacterium]
MIIRIYYTTVKRWIDQYEKIGLQALEPKKRGRKLGTGR